MTAPDDIKKPVEDNVQDLLSPASVKDMYEYIAQLTEELRAMAASTKDRPLTQLLELARDAAGTKYLLLTGRPVSFDKEYPARPSGKGS